MWKYTAENDYPNISLHDCCISNVFLDNNDIVFEFGVFRISCGCMKDNIGSEKVMIKCGMTKEADFKSFVWHDGKLKDRVEYRILKSEWKPS